MATYYKDQTSDLTLAEQGKENTMLKEPITVLFDYADRFEGRLAVAVSYRNKRWTDWRDAGTAEGSKIASDIETTARRFGGFAWIKEADRFMTARELQGDEPRKLVDAFRDQGFNVVIGGAYRAGKVKTRDEIENEPDGTLEASNAFERAHVASRDGRRHQEQAGAIQRLQAAARAEEQADAKPTNVSPLPPPRGMPQRVAVKAPSLDFAM